MRFEVGERQQTPVEERVEVEFQVADKAEEEGYRTLVAYLPTAEQAAYLSKLQSRYMSKSEKVAGLMEFCSDVFPEDTDAYLAKRARDPFDPFDFVQLMNVVQWLAKQFKIHAEGGNRPARRAADRGPALRAPAQARTAPRSVSVKELAARAGVNPDDVMAASELEGRSPRAKKAAGAPAKKAPAKRPASKAVAARHR